MNARAYSMAAELRGDPPHECREGCHLPNTRSFKERVGALKNLWPFLTMVWRTSRSLTAASLLLRLARALLPVITLYVGKLIIDDVVMLVQTPDKPETLQYGSTAAF